MLLWDKLSGLVWVAFSPSTPVSYTHLEAEKAAGKQAEKVDRELVDLEKQMEQAESVRKSFARLQETREKLERLKEKAEEMKQEEERLKLSLIHICKF